MTHPEDPSQDQDQSKQEKTTGMMPPSGESGAFPPKIGPYTIKRVIASGGMGTVYEATQENPRRPAAVKVVKRNMASPEAVRRFQREAQALARLRHPGIAQIYEAGTYEDAGISLPFFALEYIPNARTIIQYADAKNLDVEERLALFLQVCQAVHYGHQRGIIHRDLKPGNILADSEGRIRIIDFGVARAVDADQEQTINQTMVGQIIGTPQYMSPEQFEADPNDLDTRSDVYALGVVLYELLSGKLPYDIQHSGLFEIARTVREEQPTTLGAAVPDIGGEIELITAKALQKNRENRYQSAFGFAEDIQRYLKGEAISAKPSSLAYQVKILARKNKAVVGLASVAIVLLIVGIVTTTGLYLDVNAERERTEIAAQEAIAARDFLTNTLEAIVPWGYGDVKTIGDLCDVATHDIDDAFPGQPVTEAEVRNLIGQIYMRIDNRPLAEQQLRKAYSLRSKNLGPDHDLSRQTLNHLIDFYHAFGPSENVVEASELNFEITAEYFGSDIDRMVDAQILLMNALYGDGQFARAEKIARQLHAETSARHGNKTAEAMDFQLEHANFLLLTDNLTQARDSAEEVYQFSVNSDDGNNMNTSYVKQIYAATLLALGEIEKAKELYNQKPTPDSFVSETQYQGSQGNLNEGVKVLVFFETWCPYSQKYIPRIEAVQKQYRDSGIDVIGWTQVNKSSSDDRVRKFILENHLSFSVLKDNGRPFSFFDAAAVPYTVVLHEGEIVWQASGAGMEASRVVEGIAYAK